MKEQDPKDPQPNLSDIPDFDKDLTNSPFMPSPEQIKKISQEIPEAKGILEELDDIEQSEAVLLMQRIFETLKEQTDIKNSPFMPSDEMVAKKQQMAEDADDNS